MINTGRSTPENNLAAHHALFPADELRDLREFRILLEAAHVRMTAHRIQLLAEMLQEPFDGEHLVALARRHEVHPLLERALSRVGFARDIPWRSKLRIACQETLARNLILLGELERVLPILHDAGAPALTLKGPSFAREVYGWVGLRTSGDLDLWIRKGDIQTAVDALAVHGYRPWAPLRRDQVARLGHFEKAGNLVREGRSIPLHLDLHWDVAGPEVAVTADLEGIWRRAENASALTGTSATFAREDLLLFLLIHGYSHNWDRLKYLCDIDACVGRPGPLIDWTQVARRARVWKVSDIVERGIRLSAALLGTPLPDIASGCLSGEYWVSDRLRDPATFFEMRQKKWSSTIGGWADRIGGRRGQQNRLRQILASFHPRVADLLVWPRGAGMVWLYWLLRPLRLSGRVVAESSLLLRSAIRSILLGAPGSSPRAGQNDS